MHRECFSYSTFFFVKPKHSIIINLQATGIFAHPDLVMGVYGSGGAGIIYGQGIKLLLVELIGVGFILGWVTAVMTPFFIMLKMLGVFRVDPLEEVVGLDISHHKGAAYDLQAADEDKVDEFIERRSHHGKAPSGPPVLPQSTFTAQANGGDDDSVPMA